MNKSYDMKIMDLYIKQLKNISPYLNNKKLAQEIGVAPTTLWRFLNEHNHGKKTNLDIIQKLETIGILKAPFIIKNVIETNPNFTCTKCGCTEFLCGHNKRD